MSLTPDLFPSSYLISGSLLFLVCLCLAIYKAPWYRLKNASDANILFAATLIIWLFWRTRVGINPGLEYHLLMMTSLTLMFGWAFALICASVVQLGLLFEGVGTLSGFGLTLLVSGVIPILFTHYFYLFVYRTLPHHFFIYIFIVAFFGASVTMLISRLIALVLFLVSDTYTLTQLGDDPWFILLMLFPEAFLNGFVMTLLVVYRPEWLSSFDDKQYLYNR